MMLRRLALLFINVASLTSALLLAQDTPQETRGNKLPPGTYQLTCLTLDFGENTLKAVCQTMNGDWRTTELKNTDRCPGDIENINGKLKCTQKRTGRPVAYLNALAEVDPRVEQPFSALAPMQTAHWQLQHDTWLFKDGAPEGVRALAQTGDGFLWLGGPAGLYRFDGRQFELFRSPFGEELLSSNIASLYAPPGGGLWIGYLFGGASFLDNGRLKNYGGEFAAGSGSILSMVQDKDGIVWAAGTGGLWRFDRAHWEHIGMEWNVPLKWAYGVAIDRDGNLWVGGDQILLRLPRGSRQFQIVESNLPADALRLVDTQRLLDQEGSIWLGSQRGLERFRYSPLVRPNMPQSAYGFTFAAADDGTVLAGGWDKDNSLYRFAPGEMKIFRKYEGWSIAFIYRAPDTTMWLGSGDSPLGVRGGIWHESLSQESPVRKSGEPKASFDLRKALWRFTGRGWNAVELPHEVADQALFLQAITQDREGGMWLSLGRHGLYRLKNGVWTSYRGRHDLPTGGLLVEFTDSLGRVWFGYTGSFLAMLNGDSDRVRVFGPDDGLHVGNITAIHGRGSKIWIGGEFGLQQFDAGQFKNINAVNNEWLRGISGIIETANGDLWLNGITGILHIRQSELTEALKNPSYQVKGDHLGRRDGVPGFATQFRPLPSAIEGSDGLLWFSGSEGVVWLDPAHFDHPVKAPPITIQSISADDKSYQAALPLKFPAHTSSVQINYTAISLSNPDAIRFRYKLQETDADWHEVSKATPVTYRNLSPGFYHFIVSSSDTNGAWSEQAARLEFNILPAFYQTRWFLSACIAAFLFLLAMLYRLRLRYLRHEYNISLEARLSERTRIARELHDTLLQSFQGVLLKFHAVNYVIDRPAEARKTLASVMEQARMAITEGRDAVQGLRSSTLIGNDLAKAIGVLGEDLAADPANQSPPLFCLQVEGETRELVPIVRSELYHVASEALRNAFRHAQATRIEVELRYDPREFRLRVRDNGKGIDPDVLAAGGRDGHYGFRGMHERARLVGGKLAVWSELDSGTEAELTVPATVAYAKAAPIPRRMFWRRGA